MLGHFFSETGAKGIFCGGFDIGGFGGQKRQEGILAACLFHTLLLDPRHFNVIMSFSLSEFWQNKPSLVIH